MKVLDFVSRSPPTAQVAAHVSVPAERRFALAYDSIAPLLALADVVLIVLCAVAGGSAYQLAIADTFGDVQAFAGIGLLASLAYGLAARHLELHRLQSLLQQRADYWRVLACVAFVALLLTVILFLLKLGSAISRGSAIGFVVLAAATLVAWRKLVKVRLKSAMAMGAVRGRRAILIGHDVEMAGLAKERLLFDFGFDEVARLAIPRRKQGDWSTRREIAAVQAAIVRAREADANEILLCVSWGERAQLELLREKLRLVPLPVRLLPDTFVRSIWDRSAAQPLGLIEIQRAPLSRGEQAAKRAFDLAVASFALFVLSPLMLVTAIAVKLESRGPVIFRQRRHGFSGREFEIYKFRTMTVLEDGPQVVQAKRDDARVTRLGRILRRTSIDELPQLVNVLRGDMAIVGPRPHALAHDDEYSRLIGNYAFRHHMKPGITGYAQVNGLRGGTPELSLMQRRIEQDLWYINNWSLMLDFQIALRTCFELMRSQNAY